MIELLRSREMLETVIRHFQQTHTWTNTKHSRKLNQMSLKYVLAFVSLFLISISGNIELAGIQVRQVCVWVYYIMFLLLRTYQFSIAFELIKLELEHINHDLLQLNKIKYTIDQAAIRIRLINIREAYQKVLKLTGLINNACPYSLLSMGMLMACSTVCTTYWMVLSLLKNVQIINFTIFFCQVFPTIVMMVMVTKPCQDCSDLVSDLFATCA